MIPLYKRARTLTHAAILAALYAVMTYLQNLLLPGSGSWAVQLRLSEALMVLCFFTPDAALGLAVGCLIFNLAFGAALPLDFLLGPLATLGAGLCMYRLRRLRFLGLTMPALWNGLLVGWELTFYIGGGFWANAGAVALGEGAALLIGGSLLYRALKKRRLDSQLFGPQQ